MRTKCLALLALVAAIDVHASCTPDPVTGLCVPPVTVSCVPQLLWNGTRCTCPGGAAPTGLFPDGTYMCGTGAASVAPAAICSITITYQPNSPANPTVAMPTDPRCDEAAAETAMAVALAKALGAP